MNRMQIAARVAIAILATPLAGCAGSDPINLSSQFTPPTKAWSVASGAEKNTAGSCHVHLANVQDARPDTQSMGTMGLRAVRASDTVGWVRSGVQSLSQDSRITFVDDPAALMLKVDLVQAYINSKGTEKSATVVLRAIYSDSDKPIFRGNDDSLNWNNTDSETQAGLDAALAHALEALDRDIASRCSKSS